jgi:hypothetical protein
MSDATPIVVAFGGGTNSTAMLCGFRERDIVPSLICFADTGGEMPHTYEHVQEMDVKCKEWWGIGIEVVRKLYKGEFEGLEGQCLSHKQLPSLAYGRKSCSQKYKGEPQERRLKIWMRDAGVQRVTKAIGFGADEPWRVKPKFDVVNLNSRLSYTSWYPLTEWGWRREECVDALTRHNITQAGKSSCFFCPARKRGEVLQLRQKHPELFARGVAIERRSLERAAPNGGQGTNGLHFGVKWSDMANADDEQGKLFDWIGEHASPAIPCGCYDG